MQNTESSLDMPSMVFWVSKWDILLLWLRYFLEFHQSYHCKLCFPRNCKRKLKSSSFWIHRLAMYRESLSNHSLFHELHLPKWLIRVHIRCQHHKLTSWKAFQFKYHLPKWPHQYRRPYNTHTNSASHQWCSCKFYSSNHFWTYSIKYFCGSC